MDGLSDGDCDKGVVMKAGVRVPSVLISQAALHSVLSDKDTAPPPTRLVCHQTGFGEGWPTFLNYLFDTQKMTH